MYGHITAPGTINGVRACLVQRLKGGSMKVRLLESRRYFNKGNVVIVGPGEFA